MKRRISFILMVCSSLLLFGQERMQTGIIYGKNCAFSLTAPEGWVLDNQVGVSQGLYAVFYRQGESWAKGSTVMYANIASLEVKSQTTIDELIAYDSTNFKSQYPDIRYKVSDDINIGNGVIARVLYLSGESYGNWEAMAYIDAGKSGVIIVMTSRTKEAFEDSLTSFESLVKSYLFLANKTIIKYNKKGRRT